MTKESKKHKINDLGEFGNMTLVWQAMPGGGCPGDFLHIGERCYVWDPMQGNWLADFFPHGDGYRLLHQEGDLAVDNDLRVGGRLSIAQHAKFKRDVCIEGTLVYSHLRGMDCGFFQDVATLQSALPSPRCGQWALVGGTIDDVALYACHTSGTWDLVCQGQSLVDAIDLQAYDTARNAVDDILTAGYIFCGVATTQMVNPHRPADHNVFYLTAGPGVYEYFGGLRIRCFSALLWDCQADPNHDGVAEGQWRAQTILDGVFVFAENIAEGAVTLDKAPEIRQYVDTLITAEKRERKEALDALAENLDNQELRFVDVWAEDGDMPALFTGYAWNGRAAVLYHRNGTVMEAEMPRNNLLYVDKEGNRLFRWTGREMRLVGDTADITLKTINGESLLGNGDIVIGEGGASVTVDDNIPLTNPGATHVPSTAAVKTYVDNKVAQSSGTDREGDGEGYGAPDFNDPLRPEYYLRINNQLVRTSETLQSQVLWGVDYYDRPLRCYNGTASYHNTLDSGAGNICVFAPSERIVYNVLPASGNYETAGDIRATTEQVVYNTVTDAFVLVYGDHVYTVWGNSSEWNDAATGKARTDVLFSDISPAGDFDDDEYLLNDECTYYYGRNSGIGEEFSIVDGSKPTSAATLTTVVRKAQSPADHLSRGYGLYPAKRTTKVFDGSTPLPDTVDISMLMTDFADAIAECVAANNGAMRLSNRIYYCSRGVNITGMSGFTVDGGRGVLFVRRLGAGRPQLGVCRRAMDVSDETAAMVALCRDVDNSVYYRGGEVETAATRRQPTAAFLKEKLGSLISALDPDDNTIHAYKPYGDAISTDSTASVFTLTRVTDATFRNITIRALRDADDGTAGGHVKFSSSDSRLQAFTLYRRSGQNDLLGDLRFEHLDCKGMAQDFNCSSVIPGWPYNIMIDGWKSDAFNNSIRGHNWVVNNADLHQNDYCGPGLHVLYLQGVRGMMVSNSRFVQGRYTSVMITTHGGKGSDIHFDNCTLIGGKLLQGYGSGQSGWIYFTGCHLQQVIDVQCGNDHVWNVPVRPIHGSYNNWSFVNCRFDVFDELVQSAAAGTKIYLLDCGVTSKVPVDATNNKVGANLLASDCACKVYVRNFDNDNSNAEWQTPVQLPANVKDISSFDTVEDTLRDTLRQDLSSALTEVNGRLGATNANIATVNELVVGNAATIIEYESDLPGYGSEDDAYYVMDTGKAYANPSGGTTARICLMFSNFTAPEVPMDITFVFTLNTWEQVVAPFTVTSESTITSILNDIRNVFLANGYESTGGTVGSGQVRVAEGSIISVGAKRTGVGWGFSRTPSDSSIPFSLTSLTNKSGMGKIIGTNCVWQEVEAGGGGLMSRVSVLERKHQRGQTSARPELTLNDVGMCFFDVQLGKPVWAALITPLSGDPYMGWIDAAGEEISN